MPMDWDSFNSADDKPLASDEAEVVFGTHRTRFKVKTDGAPRDLAEAYRRAAAEFGGDPNATVQFRAVSRQLKGDENLEAGVTYVATVTADRHSKTVA